MAHAQQRLAKVLQDAKLKHADVVQQWAHMVLRDCGTRETLLPFTVITDTQATRLERVCTQLRKSQVAAVSTQGMRSVLTADEYSSYANNLSAPTSLLDAIRVDGKPDEIVRYSAMLKKADWTNARAEAASRRFSTRRYGTNGESQASYLYHQAEHQYERACEYLDEHLEVADGQTENIIRAWLDRDFDWSTAGSISIDCVGVARAIDSSSKHCQTTNTRKQHKLAHKLSCQQLALTQAACVLLYQAEPEPEPVAANGINVPVVSLKLRALMALPGDEY